MERWQRLDPRFAMALLGGAIGVALVVLVSLRSPSAGDVGTGPIAPGATVPTAEYEPLGVEGLYRLYSELGSVKSSGSDVTVSVSRAGDIVLPSGQVIASDAFYIGRDSIPFTVSLPAGKHPVYLLHVVFRPPDDRVAAAMIRVASTTPVRWEPALTAGQKLDDLASGEFWGYGVDTGTGGFASPETAALLGRMDPNAASEAMDRLQAGFGTGGDSGVTSSATIDQASGVNLVAFYSGFGDGYYPSYFGFDESGRAVALLTSFGIIDDPAHPVSPAPSP